MISKDEAKAIADKGWHDPPWFFSFFLKDWFPLKIPPVHLGLIAILLDRTDFLEKHYAEHIPWIIRNFVVCRDPDNEPDVVEHIFEINEAGRLVMHRRRFILVMMPRGTSKTTVTNACNIFQSCYRNLDLIAYFSETGRHASGQLENVANELAGNELIKAVFGELKPDQKAFEESEGGKWSPSNGEINTTNGTTIVSRGRGAQARGIVIRGKRPKLNVFDDVEDKESVATPEQRVKTVEWMFGDVIPGLQKVGEVQSSAIVLATLLHAEAMVTQIESDPDWTTIKFGAYDRDGEPLWPDWMTSDEIEAERQSYARKALLHIFYMEYFNTIRAPEDAAFKPHYIIVEPIDWQKRIIATAIAMDPALSPKRRASHAVIAVVGARSDGVTQVLDMWGKRGNNPRSLIDKFFEMHLKWYKPGIAMRRGIESVAFQASLIHLVQEEMFKRAKDHGSKVYFECEPITHSRADGIKVERIQGILQPRYSSGWMRHQRVFPELVTALLDWPNGVMDFPDAEAMAMTMLDDYVGIGGSDSDSEPDDYGSIEDLPDLEDEVGEWRTHA